MKACAHCRLFHALISVDMQDEEEQMEKPKRISSNTDYKHDKQMCIYHCDFSVIYIYIYRQGFVHDLAWKNSVSFKRTNK